jgi:pumilio RNA-binding family
MVMLHPIVKNTFLHLDDVGSSTPVKRRNRRIQSAGAVLISSNDAEASMAMMLKGAAVSRAFDREGCLLLQQALDETENVEEAAALSIELQGHVKSAIRSPHANFVIQKIISKLPSEHSAFIANELLGEGPSVARHAYGCRVICRLLEHSMMESGTCALVDEIASSDPGGLCRHQFGHHVAKSIMAFASPYNKSLIVSALSVELPRYARGRNASQVIELVFTCPCPEDLRCILLAASLVEPGILESLACHAIGSHVVRAFLQSANGTSEKYRMMQKQAKDILRNASVQLTKDKYGRKVLLDMPDHQ